MAIEKTEADHSINITKRALRDAQQLADRIESLVGALCGQVPSCGTDDEVCSSNGVLPDLAEMAERTAVRMKNAHADLDRLARQTGA